MRADEREKLLKEIEKKEETEGTRSMYFRVGKSAHKAITELAAISGGNKSEIVRKLVTKGLTGKDFEIGQESQSVKLDWLVRAGKRNQVDVDAVKKSMDDIRGRLGRIEGSEAEASDTSRKLLLEMYCVLLAVFWAEKQSLSKLVKLAASSFEELQHPDDIAALDMASALSSSVKDLDNLARFHDIKIGSAFGDKNYNGMKVEAIRKFVAEQQKKRAEAKK